MPVGGDNSVSGRFRELRPRSLEGPRAGRRVRTDASCPSGDLFYSFACVPSQNGLAPDRWHPHQATDFGESMTTRTGVFPVVRREWEPSQYGRLWDWPQAHQYFSPGCSLTT